MRWVDSVSWYKFVNVGSKKHASTRLRQRKRTFASCSSRLAKSGLVYGPPIKRPGRTIEYLYPAARERES